MKKIYVVRHCRTYLNKYQRLQGWSDAPLTEEGIEGAHRMGKALKDQHFDLVASSDLKRAADTRKIIVSENDNWESTEMTQTADLRELFFGYYEAFHDTEGVAAAFKSTKYPRLVDAVRTATLGRKSGTYSTRLTRRDAESGSEFESRLKRGSTTWSTMMSQSGSFWLAMPASSIAWPASTVASTSEPTCLSTTR